MVVVADPSVPALQLTLACTDAVKTGPPALLTGTASVIVQPLASVTVHV